ncbi:zinc finger protein 830 [Exaiptasia diaphana]|uniref:Zinc finger protein 830 n=1 Tax=Exaiptasia diaphana TaxID=2652724 RepID=A0A913X6I9_EXADI|nr:zinc finger protein 830 [Exaiptasia diaphana]
MAAKKVDFRRLKEERENLKKKAKIDSPLAKYNSLGQLFCVLCNATVKNELLWNAHVQGKKHKESLLNLKNKKNGTPSSNSKTENSQKSCTFAKPAEVKMDIKRKNEEDVRISESPHKKHKVSVSTNKQSSSIPSDFFDKPSSQRTTSLVDQTSDDDDDDSDDDDQQQSTASSVIQNKTSTSGLPSDFFDNKEKNTTNKARKPSEELPEGFFDDPKLDAKARHIEYKDPVELEWEKFQKEIQMENQVSEALVEEDDEVARIDRQLHELNEQSQYFLRAHDLRDKQTVIKEKVEAKATEARREDNGASSDSDDFEDFFDWRAKKAL